MVLEYDEKGKIFTDIISKYTVLTNIQTITSRIQGYVHVRNGERLSDELNKPNTFLAVTNAEIYSIDGDLLYSSDFVAINREQIIWLMPLEEPHTRSE